MREAAELPAVFREGGRCLPVAPGPGGAVWTVGAVTDWQTVLDAAAAIRRLGDYVAGEWTGLYQVEAAADRSARWHLVAELPGRRRSPTAASPRPAGVSFVGPSTPRRYEVELCASRKRSNSASPPTG